MSLDKAIEHGKEYRKPYYRSGKYDLTCRPHGGCPYCYHNRMHGNDKREPIIEDDEIQNVYF
jgi:DNA repair photolyase